MFKRVRVLNFSRTSAAVCLFFSIFSLDHIPANAQEPDWLYQGDYENRQERYRVQAPGNANGFGRLFPPMRDRSLTTRQMRHIADGMREPRTRHYYRYQRSETPAGYTFLGQFIDHDITLDTKSMLNSILPDGDLKNIRTPDLDLDSVYAGGPDETPFLYNLPYLRVGRRIYGRGLGARYDLLRTNRSLKHGPQGGEARALIGDPRNDENFIVSQLHAAFIAFHNRLTDILVERYHGDTRHRYCPRDPDCSTRYLAGKISRRAQKELFEKAREHVIHYYHRIIVEDYLPRIIGEYRTHNILVNGRRFFFSNGFKTYRGSLENTFIPLEFSVAAFRFGHSQVSDGYQIRRGVFSKLLDIKRQAHKPLTRHTLLDWRYFFPIRRGMRGMNRSRKIDTKISGSLFDLRGSDVIRGERINSLPMRNMLRSRVRQIPSGEYVASRILPEISLGSENLRYPDYRRKARLSPDDRLASILHHSETPLWLYVLQEAETHGTPWLRPPGRAYFRHRGGDEGSYSGHRVHGHTLGPVGGTIVGEVLIGLLEHYDRNSGRKGLKYKPEIKAGLNRNRYTPLSLTYLERGRLKKKRYMMRNLLIDAGLAGYIEP